MTSHEGTFFKGDRSRVDPYHTQGVAIYRNDTVLNNGVN